MQWDTPWGISIFADFRPMGYKFYAVVVFGLGKALLFKYVLGRCVYVNSRCTEMKILRQFGTSSFEQSK